MSVLHPSSVLMSVRGLYGRHVLSASHHAHFPERVPLIHSLQEVSDAQFTSSPARTVLANTARKVERRQ